MYKLSLETEEIKDFLCPEKHMLFMERLRRERTKTIKHQTIHDLTKIV